MFDFNIYSWFVDKITKNNKKIGDKNSDAVFEASIIVALSSIGLVGALFTFITPFVANLLMPIGVTSDGTDILSFAAGIITTPLAFAAAFWG